MGFLTEEESGSLTIRKMVLHVLDDGEFVPANAIDDLDEEQFFLDRVRDVDVDAVYTFAPNSQTKRVVGEMAQGTATFIDGARALSQDFARFHNTGRPRDGAFFVLDLAVQDPAVDIYALMKFDYGEALETLENAGSSQLRRIMQALIGDKKAIQKSCLIRVVGGQVEDSIATHDRMKNGSDIVDYFAAFLEAQRTRTDRDLNRAASEAIKEILSRHRDELPARDVARAVRTAKAALRGRQQIDQDAIEEAILAAAGNPADEGVRSGLLKTVGHRMKARKLQGLQFRPDGTWTRPILTEIKTREGVIVRFPDDQIGGTVFRTPRQGGGESIRIETQAPVEVAVVRESPSRAN